MDKPEPKFPTPVQFHDFKRGRLAGRITFFRTAACSRCAVEIPKGFTFCTQQCHDEDAKEKAVTWIINLDSLLSGTHRIETTDGAMRTGKITKINYKTVKIDGQDRRAPMTIELNDDASDFVSWEQIKEIKRE